MDILISTPWLGEASKYPRLVIGRGRFCLSEVSIESWLIQKQVNNRTGVSHNILLCVFSRSNKIVMTHQFCIIFTIISGEGVWKLFVLSGWFCGSATSAWSWLFLVIWHFFVTDRQRMPGHSLWLLLQACMGDYLSGGCGLTLFGSQMV